MEICVCALLGTSSLCAKCNAEMGIKMTLADKIMNLRKKCGWSQEELADQLEISRQSVSKWESGASVPELDKIVKMSSLFGVSTDYLLKEEAEEPVPPAAQTPEDSKEVRSVSLEEASVFLKVRKEAGKWIALGCSICILSPVCLLLLAALAEAGAVAMTEDMVAGVGVSVLLGIVAAGVAFLIPNGMRLSPYEYLEKEEIALGYGVAEAVRRQKADYEPFFRRAIALNVVLIIIGVIPLMITMGFQAPDLYGVYSIDILLVLVSVAVFGMVRASMVYGGYQILLQEEDYTVQNKAIRQRIAPFPAIYWCTATAVYLLVSFRYGNWEDSWIVWPVAGLLFVVLLGILKIAFTKKAKK